VQPTTESVLKSDNIIATTRYQDGSVCSLLYTAMGPAGLAKEQLEICFDETAIIMEDYRSVSGYGLPSIRVGKQDKGHRQEWREFYQSVKAGIFQPIAWSSLRETFLLSFQVERLIRGAA
jgi:hypothetical protein